MRSIGPMELIVIFLFLILTAATVVPFCMISKRLGYAPWWGLLVAVPLGTVLWGYFVAFAKWPKEQTAGIPPQLP